MDTNLIDNLKTFYTEALLHIVWMVIPHKDSSSTRHLVFSLLELYPNEITSIPIPEQGEKFNGFRLYYQRVRIESVEDAIKFYRSIVENGSIPMFWDAGGVVYDDILNDLGGENYYILCGDMQDVKTWPSFTLSKRDDDRGRPFIADAWDVCRMHQIFPEKREQFLLDFMSEKAVGAWLEQYLTWNICIYPELIGGINLVLPNPYYRTKLVHMVPALSGESDISGGTDVHGRMGQDGISTKNCGEVDTESASTDSVKIDFQKRAEVEIPELKIVSFEMTYFGILACGETILTADSVTIPLAGRAEKFGFYVEATEGIIDYEFFNGFWKGFTLDIFTGYATKEVHKPGKNEMRIVDVYSHFNTSKYNENEPEIEKRFHDAEILRLRNRKVKESGFKTFYNDHEGAERFLQQLIGRAHKSVMIVDPYYSTTELFDYAVHVSVVGMSVSIVTSADHLKSKSRIEDVYPDGTEPLIGDEFKAQLDHYREWESGNLSAFVMTGDAAIHDRFLLVDDDAWFCGGSFNEVGHRLSCIIKIPDARIIHNQITEIINSDRVKEFNIWYQNWKRERQKNIEQ